MLDGINESIFGNLSGLGLLAGWAMGLGAVALTVIGGLGVLRWATGKLSRGSENQTKGLASVVLAIFGGVVLGGLTAAMSWGSTGAGQSGGLAALMPEDARPGSVTIERDSPVVSCDGVVSWEADTGFMTRRPTSDANDAGWQLLGALDVEDQAREFLEDWNSPATGPGDPGTWDIAEVEWIPDADAGECSAANEVGGPGTTVDVTAVIGRDSAGFAVFSTEEFTIPAENDD